MSGKPIDYAALAAGVRQHIRFRENSVPRVPSVGELREWEAALTAAQQQGQAAAWFPTNGKGEIIRNYGDGSPVYASRTKDEAEQAKRCHLGATGPVIPLYAAQQPEARGVVDGWTLASEALPAPGTKIDFAVIVSDGFVKRGVKSHPYVDAMMGRSYTADRVLAWRPALTQHQEPPHV